MLICKECGKKYKWHNKWLGKHAKKFKHYKFKKIENEFKYTNDKETS